MSLPFGDAVSAQVRRSVMITAALAVLVMLGVVPASAQSSPAARMSGVTFNNADDPAPLPAQAQSPAQPLPQAQPQPESKPKHGGIGIGIKGGPMFAKLDSSGATTFQQKAGYQVGLFIGGNRPGVFGVGTEITYIKRNAQAQGNTTASSSATALEIPLLFRLNAGSGHLSGADVYVLFGPAIDINMTKFSTAFVSNTTSYDLNGVAGVGVEITRVILEFRYNRGFRSVARTLSDSTVVNMHSFVLLAGFRFN
jgi:hypothetical protein